MCVRVQVATRLDGTGCGAIDGMLLAATLLTPGVRRWRQSAVNWSNLTRLCRPSTILIMETVSIYEAKTRFSQLVDKAAAGEDVIVSRHGKPIVRITRLAELKPRVRFGVLASRVRIGDDFDAPLPDDVLAGFEDR